MQRLIDAEDIKDYWVESEGAKEEFIKENMPDDADYTEYSEFFDKMLQAFKNVVDTSPTIDVEPVVHGHWVRYCDGAELQLICSNCGYEYIEADPDCTEEHNYCPHCGAKMDEEQE